MSAPQQALMMYGGGGGGGGTDPNFADVELLLHMDGSDGSTTFTDSSSNGHTVTANGDAQIDTAQSQWGGASGLFDGAGDYLSVTAAGLNIRTDSWTIEFWVRFAGGTNGTGFFGSGANQFYAVIAGGAVYMGDGGSNPIATAHGFSAGTWYHVAFTFDGTTYRYFENGGLVASSTTLLANRSITSWQLGALTNDGYYLNGWLDDYRITFGVARYTAGFTPPAAPFPDS